MIPALYRLLFPVRRAALGVLLSLSCVVATAQQPTPQGPSSFGAAANQSQQNNQALDAAAGGGTGANAPQGASAVDTPAEAAGKAAAGTSAKLKQLAEESAKSSEFKLPGLDAKSSRVLAISFAWLFLGVWALWRFLTLGYVATTLSNSGALGIVFGTPGVLVAMVAFFSHFLVALSTAQLVGVPEPLSGHIAIVLSYVDWIPATVAAITPIQLLATAPFPFLVLSAVLTVAAELLLLPIRLTQSGVNSLRANSTLSKLERAQQERLHAVQGSGPGVRSDRPTGKAVAKAGAKPSSRR